MRDNEPTRSRRCSVEGCDRPHKARGYCAAHHNQLLRGAEITPLQRRERGRRCSVPDCDRPHYQHDLCTTHYYRMFHHGWDTPERKRA